jgi:hypothetical protein
MNPHFKTNDVEMFKKYIKKSKIYLEYGSGGSTYYACKSSNIQEIYSVESDIKWIKKVQSLIQDLNKCKFIYIDISSNGNWGKPGKNATNDQCKKYSDPIDNSNIDLILIDGRFRVACALKCFNINSLILFDDFLNRPKYHVILQFYNIVESGEIMVCLMRKDVEPPPLELIEKYELISD